LNYEEIGILVDGSVDYNNYRIKNLTRLNDDVIYYSRGYTIGCIHINHYQSGTTLVSENLRGFVDAGLSDKTEII